MKLSIDEARSLGQAAFEAIGFSEEHARISTDHLVDAGLRGSTFGSLARILAIKERIDQHGDNRSPIRTTRETPVSAQIDGGDNVGYVVAHHATRIAIDKAKASGIAVVGANNTYYTGLFAYYLEMATREGLVVMAAGNGPAIVAPHGASEARLGTNPRAFGFPSEDEPVIWDIGTCALRHGDLLLHKRTGTPLPEGTALDGEGRPTRDPDAALSGAILPWGGHKGSGLSIVVQLLGAMCGTQAITPGMREMGFLIIVIKPDLLVDPETFRATVSELGGAIRGAKPIDPASPPRMPFDNSVRLRRQLLNEGIEVPDPVYEALLRLANKN